MNDTFIKIHFTLRLHILYVKDREDSAMQKQQSESFRRPVKNKEFVRYLLSTL